MIIPTARLYVNQIVLCLKRSFSHSTYLFLWKLRWFCRTAVLCMVAQLFRLLSRLEFLAADAQFPWPPLRVTPIPSFHSLYTRKSHDSNCKVCMERMLGHFHQEKGEKEQKYMAVSVHPYLHFNT